MRRTNPSSRWFAPRRGTPRPPVKKIVPLAGLPARGAGFSPPIPTFPTSRPVALGDLSGHGRGGGCCRGSSLEGLEPYRIPSSPVVGQEPTRAHHLLKSGACQAEG